MTLQSSEQLQSTNIYSTFTAQPVKSYLVLDRLVLDGQEPDRISRVTSRDILSAVSLLTHAPDYTHHALLHQDQT